MRERPTAKSQMSIISWTSALPFGEDLAGFEGDEPAERLLLLAKHLAEQTDELAPARRRDEPPGEEGGLSPADRRGDVRRRGGRDPADLGTVDRRAGDEVAGSGGDAETGEETGSFFGRGGHLALSIGCGFTLADPPLEGEEWRRLFVTPAEAGVHTVFGPRRLHGCQPSLA